MGISKKLRDAVRLSDKKSYQIAHEAGIHPSTLSKIMCGIDKINDNDKRILAISKVVGLSPEECFEGCSLNSDSESV